MTTNNEPDVITRRGKHGILPGQFVLTTTTTIAAADQTVLTILCGIPGSGKSTVARSLHGLLISTDAIRVELCGNINEMARNGEVFALAEQRIVAALRQHIPIVYDATNVRRDLLRAFLERVQAAVPDTPIRLVLVPCDPATAKRRIAADLAAGKGRAAVPDDVVDKMAAQWHDLLAHLDEVRALGVAVETWQQPKGDD